ncbi:DNA sulfur modification protein DndE [Mucilaginibacter sp. OK268]|jgi:DNA sulfur modification protein DndE|uniref:DndE family protein n=1 Tax=Mucilaginibacter sp. OK268 TaxID=1881048 RepID=UPI0008909BD1|nr:DndE family protein [Mucilaginibacter sp. OK268]SDP45833.1 DNA sulfur modification protein DndE [Mucilaginibacter sp. OK268]
MFSNIKTSKINRDVVTQLTNKLNLGAENVIARMAFSYSLSKDIKLDLNNIQDSAGKEYNTKVLFGNYTDVYIALICVHYNLNKSDKDIPKYVKMHIDEGLQLISKDILNKDSITGTDFLINEIEKNISFF